MDSFAAVCREQFSIDHPDLERDIVAHWDGVTIHAGERTPLVFAAALTGAQMRRIGLYPGAAEATHELRGLGYRVMVMTDRDPDTAEDIAAACLDLGIAADELRIGRGEKIGPCLELGVRLLVDDKPTTISAARAAGLAVATLGHPYNLETCAEHDLTPARDWSELRLTILRELGEPVP